MNSVPLVARLLIAVAIPVSLAACDREATQRAAAQTGQKVEQALDRTQEKLASTGEKLKPSLERAGEKISAAAAKTGEKISETAQRATAGMKDSTVENTRTTATTSAPNGSTTTVTTGERSSISGISSETRASLGDAAITASIKADYLKDPDLSVLRIDVDTDGGVVTLNGTAENAAARQRAERIAGAIKGVREVRNYLTIKKA